MKNSLIQFSLIFIVSFCLFSCENDDDDNFVEDSNVGVERFDVISISQIIADESSDIVVGAPVGENRSLQFQGYVTPSFLSSVTVDVQINFSDNLTVQYNGQDLASGSTFTVEEWFSVGNKFNLEYSGNNVSQSEINLVFVNSLGSKISLVQPINIF